MLGVYKVCEGLYQRGAFINHPLEKKLEFIQHYKIDVVINFWHKSDDELKPHLWKYVHKYFPDSGKTVDKLWLLDFASEVAWWIDNGHVVLTHCFGGNNRSGMFNALVLRELYNIDGEEAMLTVQAMKSRAIHNTLYQEFLRGLPRL